MDYLIAAIGLIMLGAIHTVWFWAPLLFVWIVIRMINSAVRNGGGR